MATIAKQTVDGVVNVITRTQLDGTDTLGSKSGSLYIQNETGSPEVLTIDGDAAPTALECAGAGELDLSAGYNVTIAAGGTVKVPLGKISQYLNGTVAITGAPASGVFAWIE